jgi:hypothetical protein
VAVLAGWQVELCQHASHVALDGAFGEREAARDRVVRQAFGHQREHFAFAIGKSSEGVLLAADELR